MMHLAPAFAIATLVLQSSAVDTFAQISGRVVVAATSMPLAGARVTLTPTRGPSALVMVASGPAPQCTTNDDGRFVFERLPPGEYAVRVSKAGFVSDGLMFPGDAPPRRPITVSAGQRLDLGDWPVVRGGVIAGRVLDPNGEPMGEVRVFSLRALPPGVLREPEPTFLPFGPSVMTNDLGEFRLFGLPAATYTVAAVPVRSINSTPQEPALPVTTFFPGSTDARSAATIVLTGGEAVNDVEIRVAAVPVFTVSGVVVDQTGTTVARANVMLNAAPATHSPGIGGAEGNVVADDRGRFRFGGVAAGSYRLHVAGVPAPYEIVVSNSDVKGLRIVIQAR